MSRIYLIDDRIFNECTEAKQQSQGKTPFWRTKFEKFKSEGYNFKDAEDLRDLYRKKCKQLGIKFDFTAMEDKANINRMPLPRIAVVDIETLPGECYYFDIWNQNIGIEQIIEDICILGWSGKYLNESEIFSDILTPKEALARDTKRVTESAWKFLKDSNIIVGHNILQFDQKHLNTEFLMHDMNPLKFTVVDTLAVAKQNMKFTSNKLKFINQKLGIRQKKENEGFALWKECAKGNPEALKNMKDYNEGDVFSTEELFYKFRPYIRNINVALYNEILTPQCPVCGSTNLVEEGYYYTPAGKWTSIRCGQCKAVSRGKDNLLSKEKRKSLRINS